MRQFLSALFAIKIDINVVSTCFLTAMDDCVNKLNDVIKCISSISLEPDTMKEILQHIDICYVSLSTYIKSEDIPTKPYIKAYKCLKCNETNPARFNRKKSECTPCMSKAGYEKIKVKLEQGKERNILARIAREKCSVCGFKVIRENAQMFDWDHKNPSEKLYAISKMNYKTDESFFTEIAKCELTCRNCHMMRTMRQFNDNVIPKRKSNNVITQ